jgi:hypothetical protein
MTISRGQMKRQLYQGGGIMGLSKEGIGGGDYKGYDMGSRVGFGILKKITGGVRKAVKGVTGAVKDIASSDIGKAALLYGATAGLGSIGSGLTGMARFAPSNFMGNVGRIGSFLTGGFPGSNIVDEAALTGKQNIFQKALGAVTGGGITGNLGKFAALGAVSTFLTSTLGMSPEQAEEEVSRDPSKYLSLYYKNLNPKASEQEVQEFVTANTSEYAEGGRIGYAEAGPVLPEDPTKPVNPFTPKPTGPVLPNKEMAEFDIDEYFKLFELANPEFKGKNRDSEEYKFYFEDYWRGLASKKQEGRGLAALGGRIGYDSGTPDPKIPEEFLEDLKRRKLNEMLDQYYRFQEDYERRKDMAPTQEAAMGGRIGYALGDTASQNAMQAAGIEGLPMRQNPKGVKELDLRDNGGFIPPVGIKEKEDDIPAMLSNNEFVFTADAVRGMGDGDVELGAQRMYDQMKTLEEGGRV